MTYRALARKWRPRTFTQLVGQEPVVKVLSNSLDQNRLHHAFLFTGTRGVGKTSVARLFAKAMNCEITLSSTPCLTCETCVAIENGCFVDFIEMDAASHTGVDNIREILDNVRYVPAQARFKVYLIDEVHMLSTQSFNALLKTLEEPPEHVKFLLATTDPQKLPKTVLSRCLQFHLKNLSHHIIQTHLQYVLHEEHFAFEAEALEILAKAAQGSMRDALSLLDQAIANSDTAISVSGVKEILGYTQQDYALQLLQALSAQSAQAIQDIIQAIAQEGGHFTHVLDETLSYLHEINVYQILGKPHASLGLNESAIQLAGQFSPEDIQLFYQIALKGSEEMHFAPSMQIGFNMIFLRMLVFKPATAAQSVLPVPQDFKREEPEVVSEPVVEEIIQQPAPPILETRKESASWTEIIQSLNLQGMAFNALRQTELEAKNDNMLVLKITEGHRSLFTSTICNKVETALSGYYAQKIRLTFQVENEVQSAPARQYEQQVEQGLQEAERALQEDPVFQQLQKDFSAELIKDSIKNTKNAL